MKQINTICSFISQNSIHRANIFMHRTLEMKTRKPFPYNQALTIPCWTALSWHPLNGENIGHLFIIIDWNMLNTWYVVDERDPWSPYSGGYGFRTLRKKADVWKRLRVVMIFATEPRQHQLTICYEIYIVLWVKHFIRLMKRAFIIYQMYYSYAPFYITKFICPSSIH